MEEKRKRTVDQVYYKRSVEQAKHHANSLLKEPPILLSFITNLEAQISEAESLKERSARITTLTSGGTTMTGFSTGSWQTTLGTGGPTEYPIGGGGVNLTEQRELSPVTITATLPIAVNSGNLSATMAVAGVQFALQSLRDLLVHVTADEENPIDPKSHWNFVEELDVLDEFKGADNLQGNKNNSPDSPADFKKPVEKIGAVQEEREQPTRKQQVKYQLPSSAPAEFPIEGNRGIKKQFNRSKWQNNRKQPRPKREVFEKYGEEDNNTSMENTDQYDNIKVGGLCKGPACSSNLCYEQ